MVKAIRLYEACMERHRRRGVELFLSISVLLWSANAENTTYPTANNNLNPIKAWRSAEYCMWNHSDSCPKHYTLNHTGWLNVTYVNGASFCVHGGCAEHTRWVLNCLLHVKKDYKFTNGANIKDINDTIHTGCDTSQGFSGVSVVHLSDGYRLKSPPKLIAGFAVMALLLMSYL